MLLFKINGPTNSIQIFTLVYILKLCNELQVVHFMSLSWPGTLPCNTSNNHVQSVFLLTSNYWTQECWANIRPWKIMLIFFSFPLFSYFLPIFLVNLVTYFSFQCIYLFFSNMLTEKHVFMTNLRKLWLSITWPIVGHNPSKTTPTGKWRNCLR